MRKSEKRHWSLGRSILEMVSGVAAVALSVAIYATPTFAIEGASSLNPVGSGASRTSPVLRLILLLPHPQIA